MIEIIPAIDIIDGKCVRLTQGDYNRKIQYSDNPLEVAKNFEAHGIRRLHIVDLDGAKASHIVNVDVLEAIAGKTSLVVDFGGGIKSDDDLKTALDAGASMVTIGSMALKSPSLVMQWILRHGPGRFIIGADLKDGKISVNGWLEEGDEPLSSFIRQYVNQGVEKVLCTDIAKDGMLQGTSTELYQQIMEEFPSLYLIASGGVGCIDDIRTLNDCHIPAVVIGKAFYEGKIKLDELKEFIA